MSQPISYTLIGPPLSYRRYVSSYVLALLLSTIVRSVLLNPQLPFVFGKELEKSFGPIERFDAKWRWIFVGRAWELAVMTWVWTKVGGLRVDPGVLSLLLHLLSVLPLSHFISSHFLLPSFTLPYLTLPSLISSSISLLLLSILLPPRLASRPPKRVTLKKTLTFSGFASLILATALGTTIGTFVGYFGYVIGGFEAHFRKQVLETLVPVSAFPSFKSSGSLATPSIHIPTLTAPPPLKGYTPLPDIIQASLLFPLVTAITSTYFLPRTKFPPRKVATLSLLLVAPQTFLTLWNLLPVTLRGSAEVSALEGGKTFLVAYVVAWVLDDLRNVSKPATVPTEQIEQVTKTLEIELPLEEDDKDGEYEKVEVEEVVEQQIEVVKVPVATTSSGLSVGKRKRVM